jgi:hypothetical protein
LWLLLALSKLHPILEFAQPALPRRFLPAFSFSFPQNMSSSTSDLASIPEA